MSEHCFYCSVVHACSQESKEQESSACWHSSSIACVTSRIATIPQEFCHDLCQQFAGIILFTLLANDYDKLLPGAPDTELIVDSCDDSNSSRSLCAVGRSCTVHVFYKTKTYSLAHHLQFEDTKDLLHVHVVLGIGN